MINFIFFPSFLSLSASLQARLVCHVLGSLWIQEWNWQCRTSTVPRGTWCPSVSAVSKSQPVLNESLSPNLPWQRGWIFNPDGKWTLFDQKPCLHATVHPYDLRKYIQNAKYAGNSNSSIKIYHYIKVLLNCSKQVPQVWVRATAKTL